MSHPESVEQREHSRPDRFLFATLALLTTITAIAGSLGAPLVPGIARLYDVSLLDAQWSLTVTLLVGAASTPVLGRMSTGPHRTRVVVLGLGAVTLGGLLCSLPLGFGWFLTGRGLQGLGYGLTPVAIAVAREALPEVKRGNAIAILSITTVAGAGLGYPIAATLADAFGIRVAFAAGTVLCAATLLLAVATLPASRAAHGVPVDWWGTLLLSGGTTAALLALVEAGEASTGVVVGLVVLALVAWTGWVWWSGRAAYPIVNLALATRPVPLLAHATSMLIGVGVYLLLPLVVVVVQADGWGLGYGATAAGWLLVPYSLISVGGSRVGRRLGRMMSPLMLLPLGSVTYLASFVLITLFHHTVWQLAIAMAVAGLGSGLALATIPNLLVRAVPLAETGSAMAFTMVVRYLGFSVGSTLGLVALSAGGEVDERAFVRAMLLSCAVGGLTVVTSLALALRAHRMRW